MAVKKKKHSRRPRVDPVKKAWTLDSYTAEQIQELQKCSTDFMYFATHYIYVQHPTKGKILFEPYPYQIVMLQSLIDYGQLVFMCGRQLGKTTCAAIYILWRAIFQDDQTILIAGNKNDTAIEVMDRIKFVYETLPMWLKPGQVVYNKKNVVFENNSEIITRATTKDTGRGLSISLLYCLAGGTTVKVRDKITLEEKEISLAELYKELLNLDKTTFILGIDDE